MVSVRKLNHDFKIKEEFIDRVDISKGLLAPIFGAKSVTNKDTTTTTRGADRQNDDTLPHRQSRQNGHGKGRGTARGERGKSREKRDKLPRASTSIKLRSIVEIEVSSTNKK